jgi:hypothetical protein
VAIMLSDADLVSLRVSDEGRKLSDGYLSQNSNKGKNTRYIIILNADVRLGQEKNGTVDTTQNWETRNGNRI